MRNQNIAANMLLTDWSIPFAVVWMNQVKASLKIHKEFWGSFIVRQTLTTNKHIQTQNLGLLPCIIGCFICARLCVHESCYGRIYTHHCEYTTGCQNNAVSVFMVFTNRRTWISEVMQIGGKAHFSHCFAYKKLWLTTLVKMFAKTID